MGSRCRHGTGAGGKLEGFIVENKNHSNAGKHGTKELGNT